MDHDLNAKDKTIKLLKKTGKDLHNLGVQFLFFLPVLKTAYSASKAFQHSERTQIYALSIGCRLPLRRRGSRSYEGRAWGLVILGGCHPGVFILWKLTVLYAFSMHSSVLCCASIKTLIGKGVLAF